MNRPSFLPDPDNRGANRGIIAAIGYVAFALAVVIAVVPFPPNPITSTLQAIVGTPALVVIAGLVGGGYGLVQLYRVGTTDTERPVVTNRAPERAHYAVDRLAGEGLDDAVETVGGELPGASAKNWWTYREKTDVSRTLTELAVKVLASEFDVSREAATRMIGDGSWTDDPRAAAFLGGKEVATLPLRTQFVDWLSGKAYERRVEATVAAIARHAGLAPVEAADGSATAPDGSATGPADGSATATSEPATGPAGSSTRTATGSALPVREADPDRIDAVDTPPAAESTDRERASGMEPEDGASTPDADDPANRVVRDGSEEASDRPSGTTSVDDDTTRSGESAGTESEAIHELDDQSRGVR